MENLLPSDIWRAQVLPFLDLVSRIEMNQTLERETRLTKNVKDGFARLAEKIAVASMRNIIRRIDAARHQRNKVKGAIYMFQFLQTGLGRLLLNRERFVELVTIKMNMWETFYSKTWWNRSPYRKKLRVSMEHVRDILLAV